MTHGVSGRVRWTKGGLFIGRPVVHVSGVPAVHVTHQFLVSGHSDLVYPAPFSTTTSPPRPRLLSPRRAVLEPQRNLTSPSSVHCDS